MSKILISKFIAVNPERKFIGVDREGYAYEARDIEDARMCDDEEDAKKHLTCWITGYPNMFSKFKVVPITISYDLDESIS